MADEPSKTAFDKCFAHPNTFQQQPIGESIKKLDQHLSGQNTDLWLAWCSVRTAFLKGQLDA